MTPEELEALNSLALARVELTKLERERNKALLDIANLQTERAGTTVRLEVLTEERDLHKRRAEDLLQAIRTLDGHRSAWVKEVCRKARERDVHLLREVEHG